MNAAIDSPPPLGSGAHGAEAYRLSAGVALFHRDGRVWMGKRRPGKGSEFIRCPWQLPQGGIEKGETPVDAAWRELLEETGTNKAELMCESHKWLYYDLPDELIGCALSGNYRGQRQNGSRCVLLARTMTLLLMPLTVPSLSSGLGLILRVCRV